MTTEKTDVFDLVLSKCGRCCCLCRRFRPIRLQVHHIVERSDGGTDDLDNLIALCLTCHTDVHTQAPFTRRFTVTELKLHRDAVYDLIAQGRLPLHDHPRQESVFWEQILGRFVAANATRNDSDQPELVAAAVEILVKAAEADGEVLLFRSSRGVVVQVSGRPINEPKNPRSVAEYTAGVEQLHRFGFLRARNHANTVFEVTHDGYLLADHLAAATIAPLEE